MTDPLTTPEYWDQSWRDIGLPDVVSRGEHLLTDAILDVIDGVFPRYSLGSVLELGGAPGRWIASLARDRGDRWTIIDSAPIGVQKSRQNFRQLNVDVRVVEGDLFAIAAAQPAEHAFVYSLGLVEHFSDLHAVLEAHVAFAADGAVILVGCPRFRGLSGLVKRTLAPVEYATHNPKAMELDTWRKAAEGLPITPIRLALIGGLELRLLRRVERRGFPAAALGVCLATLGAILDLRVFRPLRRLNGRWISSYLVAAYVVQRSSTAGEGTSNVARNAS